MQSTRVEPFDERRPLLNTDVSAIYLVNPSVTFNRILQDAPKVQEKLIVRKPQRIPGNACHVCCREHLRKGGLEREYLPRSIPESHEVSNLLKTSKSRVGNSL